MARVPVITSPCPLRWNAAPQPGRDFCGQCQRRVHNLDLLDESQRVAFLSGCDSKVCVFYTVHRRQAAPSALGIGLAAAGMLVAGSAAANEWTDETPVKGEYCDPVIETEWVVVGGTNAGRELEWVDEEEARSPEKPSLPEIDASEWLPAPAIVATGEGSDS